MKPDRDGAKGEARGTEDGSVELARQCLSLGESAGFAFVGRTDLVAMRGEDITLLAQGSMFNRQYHRLPNTTDKSNKYNEVENNS